MVIELKTTEDFRNLKINYYDSYKFTYKGKEITFGRQSYNNSYGILYYDEIKRAIEKKYKNAKEIINEITEIYESVPDITSNFLKNIIDKNYLDNVFINKMQNIIYVAFLIKKINKHYYKFKNDYKSNYLIYRNHLIDKIKKLKIDITEEDKSKFNFEWVINEYDREMEDALIKLLKYNKIDCNTDNMLEILILPDTKLYLEIRKETYKKDRISAYKLIKKITKQDKFFEVIYDIISF